MSIVGYNDDIWVDTNRNDVMENNELGAIKVANSYGPNWKNDGFAWLTYDAALNVSGAVRFVYSITLRETEPELLAEFTLNHAERDQLYMSLGISDVTKNNPSDYWDPEILTGDGGPYAFDGSTTSCDGTFVLDFTDLFQTVTGEKKYYLKMEDNGNDGNMAEVSAYRIHHIPTGETVEYQGPLPETVDNNHVLLAINFEPGDNIFPVAEITTSPDPPFGVTPLEVLFSGYGSSDPDGEIVSYEWDFGDGSYGTGINVSHMYTLEGEYVVTLVVTDDNNATDSETCTVTVKPHLPEPPVDLDAELAGVNFVDVRLTWTASSDDGAGDFSVVLYTIYKSITGADGIFEPVDTIPAQGIPATTYEWTDYGAGDGDPNSYFYIVRASDGSGKEDQNQNKVGKFVNVLDEGWNLISIPFVQKDTERESVLKTISGNYASVQGYHSGESQPWLHWYRNKPSDMNDDIALDHRSGYYLNMLVSDHLVTVGKVAPFTDVPLKTGWNLIGYPCLEEQRVDNALSSINRNYDRVERFDTTLDNEVKLLSNDIMEPGLGYWIHVTQDCIWTITN
jgi:PKD repeat protein